MISKDRQEEIWSEYSRTKHELMDAYSTFLSSLSNILLRDANTSKTNFLTCQKQVFIIYNRGLSSGAIPFDADPETLFFLENVGMGNWKGASDFIKCNRLFVRFFVQTKFYTVSQEKPRMLAPHEL